MWRQIALIEGAAAELKRAISFHCSRQASERGQASQSYLAIDETEVECGFRCDHRIGLGAEISIKSPKIFKLGFQALSSDQTSSHRVDRFHSSTSGEVGLGIERHVGDAIL